MEIRKKITRIFILSAIIILLIFATFIPVKEKENNGAVKFLHISGTTLSLSATQKDFPVTEKPEFKIIQRSDISPTGFISLTKTAFASVVGRKDEVKAEVINAKGDVVETKNVGVGSLKFAGLKPGAYKLKIFGGTGQYIEQDFTWGVLAINPNKSVYKTGETARFAMGVLDENGETVCDAKVELRISNVEHGTQKILKTEEGTIKVNQDTCNSKDYSLIPDYETGYKFDTSGTYELYLSASTGNGNYTISDKVEVKEQVDFDVERITTTRIFPLNNYPVVIAVTPKDNFSGTVEDKVPSTFVATYIHPNDIRRIWNLDYDLNEGVLKIWQPITESYSKVLKWDVNWVAGKTYYIAYQYDAPDESPEFYLLGNLSLIKNGDKVFEEARKWQVAVDATAGPNNPGTSGDDATTGTVTWTGTGSPGNIASNDASYADAQGSGTITSHYLTATNFGFSIPTGATINGITAEYNRYYTTTGNDTCADNSVMIIKGGTISGTNQSAGAAWPTTDAATYQTFGSTSNLWGTTWAASDINASNFGVAIAGSCTKVNGPDTNTLRVDHVRVTITYTPAVISIAGTTDVTSGTVNLAVDGSLQAQTASISGGTWSIGSVTAPAANANVIVFINGAATADKSTGIMTYSGSGNVSGMALNKHKISVGATENSSTTVAALINDYDADNDADILFTANTTTLNTTVEATITDETLNILAGDTLTVATTETSTNVNVTIDGTFTATGNATINVAGNWDNNSVFNDGTSSVTFNAASGTSTLDNTGATTHILYNLLTSSGVTLQLNSAINVTNDITIGTGTSLAINSKNIDVGGNFVTTTTGSITCASCTAGSTNMTGSTKTLGGGSGAITLYSLSLNGTVTANSTFTVLSNLTINPGKSLTLGTNSLTVGSSSSTGTISVAASSSISQSSSATTTLKGNVSGSGSVGGAGCTSTNCTFGNLDFKPAVVSPGPTFTLGSASGQTITVSGALTVGDGTNPVTVTANTNNPVINVTGAMTVAAGGGVFTSASSSTLTVGGAFTNSGTFSGTGALDFNGDFSNSGSGSFTAPASLSFTIAGSFTNGVSATFTANGGTVTLDATTGTPSITSAGDSFNNLSVDNGGTVKTWTLSDALDVNGNFLLDTSNTLSTSTNNVNVAGNWTNNGTYTASNTTTLDGAGGTTQTVAGSTSFSTLTVSASTTRTIAVTNGTTQTISTNLTLTGTSCNVLLLIRSTTKGTAFTFANSDTTPTISYVDFQDTNVTTNAFSGTGVIDSGGNGGAAGITYDNTCEGGSTSSLGSSGSFQRKTFKDEANSVHWLAYHDGDEIELKSSTDSGTTWTRETSLSYDTNDFSVFDKTISATASAAIAITSGNDVVVRRGDLSKSGNDPSVTWQSEVIALNGSGASDTYDRPFVSLDSNNYIWVGARYYNGSNYTFKAVKSTQPLESLWSNMAFGTATQLSDDQTNSNVYGNIVPLASGDMYATFIDNTALEGCKWINSSGTWKNSGETATCSVTPATASDTEGSATRGTGGVKIDDAGDPGALSYAGNKIVQTTTGTLYTFFYDSSFCEVWKSSDGSSWSEVDSANKPSCNGWSASMDIDSNNILHMVYSASTTEIRYNTMDTSTDLYGTSEQVESAASGQLDMANIMLDANDIPHVVFRRNDTDYYISYINRVGGSWDGTATDVYTVATNTLREPELVINEDNIPELVFTDITLGDVIASVASKNDPTVAGDWTTQTVDASASQTDPASIGIDGEGNTWVGYIDTTTNYVTLIKHNDADAWTTWQASVTDSKAGVAPSISFIGKTIYVFYADTLSDVKYDAYDEGTSTWFGEVNVATGTYQTLRARHTKYNMNSPWLMDFLYSDGTDIYWNYVNLRTIKIDDPGDPGIMLHSGRQVFRKTDGTLYAVDDDGGVIEMWKSSDGFVWKQVGTGPSTRTGISIAAAIDGSGNIGIAYPHSTTNWDIDYVLFSTSTDSFGTPDTSILGTYTYDANGVSVAFDSGSKPHVVVASDSFSGTYTASVEYTNKISGSWSAKKTIETFTNASSHRLTTPDITIDQNNYPQIAYLNVRDSTLSAVVGDANNPTTFGTPNDIETSVNVTDGQKGVSIAVDTLTGNTWIGTIDSDNSVDLEKHTGATWSSNWTTGISNGDSGKEPSIAIAGADNIYIFYANSGDDISYNKYDSVASSWGTERVLHTGTFQDTKVKWSYQFNNFGANKIDYLYSDGTDIYYDYFYVRRSPTKVDDASNFGTLANSSRQVVRISSGTLYSFLNKAGTCEIWKSLDNGNNWYKPATGLTCTSGQTVSVAVDSHDILHLAYLNSSNITYNTFSTSTDSFGTPETAMAIGTCGSTGDVYNIAVDSSDKPHILFECGTPAGSLDAIEYVNKTGSSWSSLVTVDTDNTNYPAMSSGAMVISDEDVPEVSFMNTNGGNLKAALGNQNNATSFTLQTLDSTVSSSNGSSIGIDSSGNTWVAYSDAATNSYITLLKHNDADAWTTWQSSVTDSKTGSSPSISVDGSNIYITYIDDQNDVVFDKYDGSTWNGETLLEEHGTLQSVKTRGSYLNSFDSNGIAQVQTKSYIFDNSDNCASGASCQDPNSVWTNDANPFDADSVTNNANTSTAGSTSSNYLRGDGTNAPGSGGTITSVRARVKGSYAVSSTAVNAAIYSGAELLGTPSVTNSSATWSSYTTLTAPTGGWTWSAIQALSTRIYSSTGGGATGLAWGVEVLVQSTSTTSPNEIDYVYSDSTDVYYNRKVLGATIPGTQDSIDTVPNDLTKTLSAVTDSTNYDVHLLYIDSSTTGATYKRWDNNGTSSAWQSAVDLDTTTTDAYPTISIDTNSRDLTAFYIDTSNGTISYRVCDVSAATSECSTSGDWAAETSWHTGTNSYLTSSYGESNEVFAEWSVGTTQITIDWDRISSAVTVTFSQNGYRWYVDNDTANPTDPWSSTTGIDLAEDTAITVTPITYDPPDTTQELRLRVNMVVNNSNLTSSSSYFKLQYKAATDGLCTGSGWTDVNTGSAWEYATSSVTDGSAITGTLSDTSVSENYVKSKTSSSNTNSATQGQKIEYDFHIIGTSSASTTQYSFRVVQTDATGTPTTILDAYTNCAVLTTEPGTADLMKHGQIKTEGSNSSGFFWAN